MELEPIFRKRDYNTSTCATPAPSSTSYKMADIDRKRPRVSDEHSSKQRRIPDPESGTNYVKCLIPNHIAGMIIGKDGQNIQKLTEDLSVTIRVSSSKSIFPGTQMRVVSSMGPLTNCHSFVSWLVGKMAESNNEGGSEAALQLKILLSHYGSGVVIGKGGSTIREIQGETGATMNITQKDQTPGAAERILTITGSQDSVCKAAADATTRAQNEEDTMSLQNMLHYGLAQQPQQPLPSHHHHHAGASGRPQAFDIAAMYRQAAHLGGGGGGGGGGNPFSHGGGLGGGLGSSTTDGLVDMTAPGATRCTIEISVPDYLCSVTIDSNLQLIGEIQNMSGCSMRVAPKGDYVQGSFNRLVTLRGSYAGTHSAYYILMQKLGQGNQEVPFLAGSTAQATPTSQAHLLHQVQGFYSQLGTTPSNT